MSDHSVFHDPSQRRWRWLTRAGWAAGAVALSLGGSFLVSLLLVPYLPPLPGISAPLKHALKKSFSPIPHRDTRLRRFLLAKTRRELWQQAKEDRLSLPHPPPPAGAISAAFYATWQEEGLHSLRANAIHLTHLMPEWVHLASDGESLDLRDWDPALVHLNKDVLQICRDHHLIVMPVFSNAHNGKFDRVRARLLLSDPAKQARLARRLRDWLKANHFAGTNVDFENLEPADYALLPPFLRVLRGALAPAGLQVSLDIEATDTPLDWTAAAKEVDLAVIMAYDEHYVSAGAGPIASFRWYQDILARAVREIPREKLIIALGNYAYDWTRGKPPAEPLTYQAAVLAARDNNPDLPPEKLINFDPKALNPTFNYEDEHGRDHEVWMLDAVTAGNAWRLAQQQGARGAALWVLGSEDPSIWQFFGRQGLAKPPELKRLEQIDYPYEIEFLGEGEILSVEAMPSGGRRSVELDARTGFAVDEIYQRLPTSFVLKRTGLKPKQIALTFDDGPADGYTPRILDALKELGVPGTFFVIGENAERFPDIVEREWREGHEIGNHTYTHPNIAAVSESRARLELTATQRALQSILGRSTILFRPPYNADAEPASAEEVRPMIMASELGYVTVGEFIDPRDWSLEETLPDGTQRARDAADIADYVVAQALSSRGSAVLLHDGGGDRTLTAAALRLLVPALKAKGFRFVGVSQLVGLSRETVMPPATSEENTLLGVDKTVFEAGYWAGLVLRFAFLSAILLGALRAISVSALALAARRREKRRAAPSGLTPSISILVPAYNERAVIGRTVGAALGGRGVLEVIVCDDGSTDGTAEEVERLFGEEPRVRLLRRENSGKGRALTEAIAASTGEILVCLDADTLLSPDAAWLMASHFADPAVGAVAGNVKVGNRVNALTKLQAVEYVTNQALDRRAYALLNAVTVVPGAAGAWRRRALEEAGGFLSDTLAEDMDLTWRVRRAGWRIETENAALAYTEAPQTVAALLRQRFRWVFGTLQCLWKHRDAMGRYGFFGRLVLPSIWLFQIVYQVLSPLIDLQMAWIVIGFVRSWLERGLLTRDWQPLPHAAASLYGVGLLYVLFASLEFIEAGIAFTLDGEPMRRLRWVFAQRFVYRQLMYAVVLRSVKAALHGVRAGWGKLDRLGTVSHGVGS
jgi:cellulose synthase/poly-beta-1,6-N-acetylglucosamine synthase-like glycosyltransferase/peptidoglycan/xylan/chitin deacetylase (PgdA/CDA1 family)/spore germination protein YaaH